VDGVEAVFEEDKMTLKQKIQGMDVVQFCEDYLGCTFFEYQKVLLRNLYKIYTDEDNNFYQRAFPFVSYRFYCILYNQIKNMEN